jgi:hypothetical protein
MIAAVFALTAFAVALLAGLAAGNGATRVLTAAVVSLFICHLVGLALGAIAERVVKEHVESYRAARPVPEFKPTGAPGSSPGAPATARG